MTATQEEERSLCEAGRDGRARLAWAGADTLLPKTRRLRRRRWQHRCWEAGRFKSRKVGAFSSPLRTREGYCKAGGWEGRKSGTQTFRLAAE